MEWMIMPRTVRYQRSSHKSFFSFNHTKVLGLVDIYASSNRALTA